MNIPNVLLNLLVFIIPIISAVYIIAGIKLFKQKAEVKVNYFSFLMLASAIYSFGYFLELNCVVLNTFLIVRDFEFLGSVLIPTFGILFVSELTRFKMAQKVKGILFAISVMLWILFITNPLHHLIYKSIGLRIIGGFAIVDAARGPAFYSLMAYYTIFLIFSIILLSKVYKKSNRRNYKNGFRFLIFSLQIPWLTILFILLGFDTYIDPVPPTIMIIGFLISINEIKNDIFELQINRWNNTFSFIGEAAFLVDKAGELVCSNKNADSFFCELKKNIKDIIDSIDDGESNRKSVAFTIDNEVRWVEVKKNGFDNKNRFTNYLLIDITERKRLETALYNEKNFLETTLISVGDGVISTDNKGNIVFFNRAAEFLTGWTQEEAKGKSIEEAFHIVDEFTRERCENTVNKVLESGRMLELANHALLISKEGVERPIEDSAAPIVQENGEMIGAVLVFRDFSEEKAKREEILYLSYHDQLTGLFNRRFYEEELKRLDKKSNLPVSIVMGDVNGLKIINDSFGHVIGDELLKKAAELIKKGCKADDIIARVGGDEFVILLPKTDVSEAEQIIKQIKELSSKEKIGGIDISISFGCESKKNEEEDIQEIFKNAEDRMYRHKLYESLSMKNKTIDLIMNTLYEKNNREMLHSKRVSEICEAIAIHMNFDMDAINQMRIAGLIHDIGKMGIDDKILNKPESLTIDELYEIRRHPEIGYRILSSANEFSEMADAILKHHERWDGKGYPQGLKGEEISLQARIIAVADSYDAMTGDRPYRKGLSEEEAIAEIKRCSATQFDANIARVLIEKVLGKEWD
jgi:diguanylate cyclase (GGDEF)-like protein/PAS domain S-box-containing protein/putative nucleotidyltransferase with HDIG domain